MALFRRARPAEPRTAIVDIGSNSVRLVVYQGPERLPAILFNEKVMAGLGRGLAETGAIDAGSLAEARGALARFAAIAREMEAEVRTVATAAVRDASNGEVLLAAARALGLSPDILSGEEEARGSGYGVISAIPDADGIVGDLGGGSLELVRISRGEVKDRVSFPLGVLRIAGIRAKGGKLERHATSLIREAGWTGMGKGLPFYLVGGSWRALARLDMTLTDYPLPIIQGYRMSADDVTRLARTTAEMDRAQLKAVPGLSSGRAATIADATALLGVVLRELGSAETVASTFGLREGLLFERLDAATRTLDPLIVGCREEARQLGRFPEHGDLLAKWIAPLFVDDAPCRERVRHAACLLADVGWRANPDFRAERGLEVALHGNWVAIEAAERAILGQALFTSLGGGMTSPDPLPRLASAAELQRAREWGLAMRLGQRLSAGLAGPLHRSRLELTPAAVRMALEADDRGIYGEAAEKRHAALAAALGRKAVLA